MAIVHPTEYYDNCHNGIDSSLLFKLLYWNDGEKKTKGGLAKYKLTYDEYEILEILSGLFGVSSYTFSQVSAGIGMLGLSNYYAELVNPKKMFNYLEIDNAHLIKEVESNMLSLADSEEGLDKLHEIIPDYQSNKYVAPLIALLSIKKDARQCKLFPVGVLKKIKSFVDKGITSSVFGIKIKNDNDTLVLTRIPKRFRSMAEDIKKIFDSEYSTTKIYRGCTAIGLYVIGYLILNDKNFICSDELGLIRFSKKLYSICVSHVPVSGNENVTFPDFYSKITQYYSKKNIA